MEEVQRMSIVLEHPDVPSTSILKRKVRNQNTINSLVKSVNFIQRPEGKASKAERQLENNELEKQLVNDYESNCDGYQKSNHNQDEYEVEPDLRENEDNKLIWKNDGLVRNKELNSIIQWRRNRSQSLPSKRFLENSGLFVEGSRSFVLLNRSNAKDTNVTLPTYELRYVIQIK